MKRFLFPLLAGLTALLSFSACEELQDENNSAAITIPEAMEELFSSGIVLDASEHTFSVSFSASLTWSVSTNAESPDGVAWLYADPSHGDPGDVTVEVHVMANPSESSRQGTVTVTCFSATGDVTKSFTVTQEGKTATPGPDPGEETFAIVPAPVTLTIDQEEILTAVMLPSNTEVKVEWKCDKPDIVALGAITDAKAKVQGLAEGKATVTAYAEGGKTATCEITVEGGSTSIIPVESITLDKTELELAVGEKYQLVATILPENATYQGENDLEWTTTDPYAVYVNGGLVTAYRVGEATITCTSRSNREVSATCHVRVTQTGGGGGGTTLESASVDPSSVTLQLDEEKVLTLVMVPADAEVTIYWESANQYIAGVQMISKTQAKVKGVSVGETTVTVHAGDKTATCAVKVEDASGTNIPVESVSLNVTELTMKVNEQFQLVATVLPENATNKEVVWSSSVPSSKLYIDTSGKLSALAECEATITVRCKANAYISASCKVTVTAGGSTGGDEEVVDLGLSVKWRSMNVGASKPEDYGNYYAWGETTTKSSYSWSNYKFGHSQNGEFSKYDTGPYTDNKTVLDPEDDAATVNLGDGWRMATYKEWKELREKCTWTWTTRNGVKGMQVTGPSGKSIFLPAAGWYDTSLQNRGSYGSYWTASLGGVQGMASAVDFISSGFDIAVIARCQGNSIRPVKD